jgi:hypothetical protein
MRDESIKPVFWLWIPLIWMICQLTAEVVIPHRILEIAHGENGPHELLQFIMLVMGFIIALRTLMQMDRGSSRWLFSWIGIATVCCLFVAIEEMSWGQSVLKWHTPEFWRTVNNQQETNFHNTSRWLNQIPRFCLEMGILFGGILMPLARCYRRSLLPKRFELIYPPRELIITALLAASVIAIDKGGRELFDYKFFARPSEVEELYLFYFVVLYLIVMKQRLVVSKPHP